MSTPTNIDLYQVVEALTRRVDELEGQLIALRHDKNALPPDVVLAISAAVAAYLGKRATIRQIHLSGETTWVHQGRAAVQARGGQHNAW